MPTTGEGNDLRRTLRPVEGSWALIGLRALLLLLSSAPAYLVSSSLAIGAGHNPYFTAEVPLSAVRLMRLVHTFSAWLPAVLIGGATWLLCDQLLTAGGLAFFSPGKETARGASRRALHAVAEHGPAHLLAFFRIVALALTADLIGTWALRTLFAWIALRGDAAGWSANTLGLWLIAVETLCHLLWLSFVGAWAFWIRAITVADGRRRTRRSALIALGVFRRSPLRAGLFFSLAPLAISLGAATLLFAWRQIAPRGAGIVLAATGWAAILLTRVYLWHWMLRAARRIYARGDLAQLRAQEDMPLRPLRMLGATLRTLTRRPHRPGR